MRLPGRLKGTTLGDLLGLLHRGRATGTLELVENAGRTHRIALQAGLVVAVELDGETTSLGELLRRDRSIDEDLLKRSILRALTSQRLLGEVLVTDFRVSEAVVGAALRRQIRSRLSTLETLVDARIVFRVAIRAPRGALRQEPLGPEEFLQGRPRARDRDVETPPASTVMPTSQRRHAWMLLELREGADAADVKRAYRRLAREVHPDLHPNASETERRALEARFAAITEAYRTLVA